MMRLLTVTLLIFSLSCAAQTTAGFQNVAALRASNFYTTSGSLIAHTQFYNNASDAGGTSYYWDSTLTADDDGVFVIKPASVTGAGRWVKIFKGAVNAMEAGVLADGTDQLNTLNMLASNTTVKEIIFDNGIVSLNGTFNAQGKILSFQNMGQLKGYGGNDDTVYNAVIECSDYKQCFEALGGKNLVGTNGHLSIQWFGAKNDYKNDGTTGSPTDNLAAITATISAAKNYRQGAGGNDFGTKIYAPSNNAQYWYYVSGTITWDLVGDFYGDGAKVSTIRCNPSDTGLYLKYPSGTSAGGQRSNIHDFSIRGGDINTNNGTTAYISTAPGIIVNTVQNTITNVEVFSMNGDGFWFYGNTTESNADLNYVVNCSAMYNSGDGFHAQGSDGSVIMFMACNGYGNGRFNYHDESFLGVSGDNTHSASGGYENVFNRTTVSVGASHVTYSGVHYKAIANGINHQPDISPLYWESLGSGGIGSFPTWSSGTAYRVGRTYNAIQNNTNVEPEVTAGWENYWIYMRDESYAGDGTNLDIGFVKKWDATTAWKAGGGYLMDGGNQRGMWIGCYTEGNEWGGRKSDVTGVIGGYLATSLEGGAIRWSNGLPTASGYRAVGPGSGTSTTGYVYTELGTSNGQGGIDVHPSTDGSGLRIGVHDLGTHLYFMGAAGPATNQCLAISGWGYTNDWGRNTTIGEWKAIFYSGDGYFMKNTSNNSHAAQFRVANSLGDLGSNNSYGDIVFNGNYLTSRKVFGWRSSNFGVGVWDTVFTSGYVPEYPTASLPSLGPQVVFDNTSAQFKGVKNDGSTVVFETTSLIQLADADYTIATGVTDILANAVTTFTANRTITLPSASASFNRKITIKNAGATSGFSVLFSTNPKITSGSSQTSLTAGNWITIISDGTDWWVVASK
jgi:hypothetical protein